LIEFAPPRQLNRYAPESVTSKRIVMNEPVAIGSTSTRTREGQSNGARWLRLVRGVLWFGGFVALISFIGDCFWNLWDHNFGVSAMTQDLLLRWLAKALAAGLFFGLFFEFPVWLAREKFPPPKRQPRDKPGA
jgi:hypothetical protein